MKNAYYLRYAARARLILKNKGFACPFFPQKDQWLGGQAKHTFIFMDYMSNIIPIIQHNTKIFNFQDNQIRIKIIDGKEYFCAKDVCDVLCYSNGKDAVLRHCKIKGVVKHDTLTNGGIQQVLSISAINFLIKPHWKSFLNGIYPHFNHIQQKSTSTKKL